MGKFLLLALVAAVLVYLLVRVAQHRGRRPEPPRNAPPPRPQGPDDDPDFLRELERRRRRQEKGRLDQGGQADGPDDS